MQKIIKASLFAAAFGMAATSALAENESFGGVGVTIYQIKDGVKVVEVIPGTPAADSKLQAGDVITAVDGVSLKGQNIDFSKDQLRGQVNKPLEITYVSEGETYTAVLRRTQITVKDLESESVESWYADKTEFDSEELEVVASAKHPEKQLVAVLKRGYVIAADEKVNATNLNSVYVEKADEFAPKAKPSTGKVGSASLKGFTRKAVSFNAKSEGVAKITVMSAEGEVVTSMQESVAPGFNSVLWNGENAPAGRYMVTIELNGSVSGKNAVLK
ncbi:MAG: PDZ domain-containing protein [Fibrobacter sp.]|nr:PDZ domain-containing protein [Fibrobacter sp.]